MTAALLENAPRLGQTEARLFTPPMKAHFNPLIEFGIAPEHSWGYQCIDFCENVLKWELLPWQKWLYVRALEKDSSGFGFRFNTLCILIARQNGKTKWLKGLTLWRLYQHKTGVHIPGRPPAAKLALIAMQGLDYAESLLDDVEEDIRNCKALRREFARHWRVNGKHRLSFKGRRSWRATTANRKGGRSFSVDLADLDELREHSNWKAFDAITPTTIARPNGQVCCTSNAGDATSIVLRSMRDGAMKKISTGDTELAQVGFFEWSVPMDKDPRNPQWWYMANPAMGHPQTGMTLEKLLGRLEAMEFTNMSGFQTEHLCQWVDALDPGIMPADHWFDTLDPKSRRAPGADVYACADINYGRSKAYVGIAARRADGKLHTEVVFATRDIDDLLPWLEERKTRFKGVAMQLRGAPISNYVEKAKELGIPVLEWGGADLPEGHSTYYDGICKHRIFHRPAPVLDRSAAATIARNLGEHFVFDRRHSPVDASPLLTMAGATWAEDHGPPELEKEPTIYAWPDEDKIAEWEREAAQKGRLP